MAVSTSTITSFAAIGVPASLSGFDPYESTTNPKRPIGFKVEDLQGNVYRWSHFGATTTQGKLVSQDISESSYADSDNVILAPTSCVTTTDNTIGSRFVEITLAAITKNQFAGGKLVITDDTGEGYTYNILGNTATDDPASGTFRLELQYPLQATLAADSDFLIIGNRYGNLEPAYATNSPDADAVGVSVGSQAAADYGWVLTKGTIGILQQGTITASMGIAVSNTTAGAAMAAPSGTTGKTIGSCIVEGDTTGYGGFEINCE